MPDSSLPDLSIALECGHQFAPVDLVCLLYTGGAATNAHKVTRRILDGSLGKPMTKRLSLVSALHRELAAQQAEGIAFKTLLTRYRRLRDFVAYVDQAKEPLDRTTAKERFKEWVRHLNTRSQLKEMSKGTVYTSASRVASLLAAALELPLSAIVSGVRMKKPRVWGIHRRSHAQNLGDAQGFAQDLIDIIASLTPEAIVKELPIAICLRSTKTTYHHWSGMLPGDKVKAIVAPAAQHPTNVERTLARRKRCALDASLTHRYPLLNLRAAADFMLFIAVTGMNREQATLLTLGDFRFQSFADRTDVRKYKGRVGGEVEFSVSPEYRPYFENYLMFRRTAYPKGYSDTLFVTVSPRRPGSGRLFHTRNLHEFLAAAKRPWIPPQVLRNTKGNVLARLAGTSEAARLLQNSEAVFTQHYLVPSHQTAAAELTAFLETLSPAAVSAQAVGPGACTNQNPDGIRRDNKEERPQPDLPGPNCRDPAGCLFCVFNRGIDNLEYAWNLLSYRTLKRIEMNRYKRELLKKGVDVAKAAVERIAHMVSQFVAKGTQHRAWVDEAEARLASGNFHPRWAKWIALVEI